MKFTPDGGRITLSMARQPEEIQLTVRDSGSGIPADFLSRVFDRFAQADSSPSRRYGGLGMGLAIVRHLIELHGGRIEAGSVGPNEGAVFTVWLPRSGPPPPSPAAAS
jgi:signal transduction histidine kinase